MNLIKKSTVFDQNIKSENYESYKIYFEKNIKFDKKVKFDKNVNVSSISPTSSHPLDVVSHLFLDQKEILANQKGADFTME